jgi:hypothetical protein
MYSPNRGPMRVYRHALDPRYNDYMLMVKNPISPPGIPLEETAASSMLLTVLLKEDTVKKQGASLCGVMEDKVLKRHELSLEDRIYYERSLENNDRLSKIWWDDKSWTRIPAEDLGLHVLDIPENENR